jgi:RNA polymerase sigma factor (sigma-70 family)
VLLRPRVQVRPQLRLPLLVQLPQDAPEVTTMPSCPRLQELVAHQAQFRAFLRRRLRNAADVEDLLQQALLRAAERLETLQQDERLEAWFYRILRNMLADHQIQEATRSVRLEQLPKDVVEASPEQAVGCACALRFLDQLRPEQGELLRRIALNDEPLAPTARDLGITANNAKVRLHRARKALRERLWACCGAGSFRACLDCSCQWS